MFTHICVSARNLDESQKFYDATLAPLGIDNMGRLGDRMQGYSTPTGRLLVTIPANGEPATSANGATIGFAAPSSDAVDAFHAAGLANGGTCEGAPGPRAGANGAYGAYLRDPVGNKICAFHGLW